jgi:hypothetical protein
MRFHHRRRKVWPGRIIAGLENDVDDVVADMSLPFDLDDEDI